MKARKARKAREMLLTAMLGLAILGAFADARSANMTATEASRSPR